MVKAYWISDNRFVFVALLLFLMWIGLMVFYYLKADEVTKDPCSICSARFNENVICTMGGVIPLSRVYYPNGTIIDIGNTIVNPDKGLDLSKLNMSTGD